MYNAYSSSSSRCSSRFSSVTDGCGGIVRRTVAVIADLVILVVVFDVVLLIVAVVVPIIGSIYY